MDSLKRESRIVCVQGKCWSSESVWRIQDIASRRASGILISLQLVSSNNAIWASQMLADCEMRRAVLKGDGMARMCVGGRREDRMREGGMGCDLERRGGE